MTGSAKVTAVDANALDWRATPHAGVEWKKLHFDSASGESRVLLRFAPGASYAAHRHPQGEEYYVLEGSLDEGATRHAAGTFVRYAPGSAHQPRSEEGCVVLVFLAKPIEEL